MRLKEFGIKTNGSIRFIDPVDYLDFLNLEKSARLVLTDSGGVQEETCILNVPCVTLRDNTERPETIDAGSNMLAGTDPEKILESVRRMLVKGKGWKNPFGDGNAAEKIGRVIKMIKKR
jgi:UDP-N-acetylglucosamine 2-epimerase (non-hydrolysing)